MRTPSLEALTRWLGLTLVVMAGFSTGLQHAHPGGSAPHEHDGMAASPGHSCPAEAETAAWLAAPLHMHIFLLGFQFTVPTQDEAQDEPSDRGDHMLVVRLMGDDVTDSAARVPAGGVVEMPAVTIEGLQVRSLLPPFTSPDRPQAAPLCDIARHERSGVQRT
jgi:hypothetical protein